MEISLLIKKLYLETSKVTFHPVKEAFLSDLIEFDHILLDLLIFVFCLYSTGLNGCGLWIE